jgi:hypothetical protein
MANQPTPAAQPAPPQASAPVERSPGLIDRWQARRADRKQGRLISPQARSGPHRGPARPAHQRLRQPPLQRRHPHLRTTGRAHHAERHDAIAPHRLSGGVASATVVRPLFRAGGRPGCAAGSRIR